MNQIERLAVDRLCAAVVEAQRDDAGALHVDRVLDVAVRIKRGEASRVVGLREPYARLAKQQMWLACIAERADRAYAPVCLANAVLYESAASALDSLDRAMAIRETT